MMLGLTILGIIDTVLPRIDPNYRPAILSEILPDWWTWQVWLMIIFLVALIATLETAYRKIKELTPTAGIGLTFARTKPVYKQVSEDTETYRVGVSAIREKIENPEVFVSTLIKLTPPMKGIEIPRLSLSPTINHPAAVINPGRTPTYFVDVFKHKTRQREIELCSSYISEPVQLGFGEYELTLMARGSNNPNIGMIELVLAFDEHGNLEVMRKDERKRYHE